MFFGSLFGNLFGSSFFSGLFFFGGFFGSGGLFGSLLGCGFGFLQLLTAADHTDDKDDDHRKQTYADHEDQDLLQIAHAGHKGDGKQGSGAEFGDLLFHNGFADEQDDEQDQDDEHGKRERGPREHTRSGVDHVAAGGLADVHASSFQFKVAVGILHDHGAVFQLFRAVVDRNGLAGVFHRTVVGAGSAEDRLFGEGVDFLFDRGRAAEIQFAALDHDGVITVVGSHGAALYVRFAALQLDGVIIDADQFAALGAVHHGEGSVFLHQERVVGAQSVAIEIDRDIARKRAAEGSFDILKQGEGGLFFGAYAGQGNKNGRNLI